MKATFKMGGILVILQDSEPVICQDPEIKEIVGWMLEAAAWDFPRSPVHQVVTALKGSLTELEVIETTTIH